MSTSVGQGKVSLTRQGVLCAEIISRYALHHFAQYHFDPQWWLSGKSLFFVNTSAVLALARVTVAEGHLCTGRPTRNPAVFGYNFFGHTNKWLGMMGAGGLACGFSVRCLTDGRCAWVTTITLQQCGRSCRCAHHPADFMQDGEWVYSAPAMLTAASGAVVHFEPMGTAGGSPAPQTQPSTKYCEEQNLLLLALQLDTYRHLPAINAIKTDIAADRCPACRVLPACKDLYGCRNALCRVCQLVRGEKVYAAARGDGRSPGLDWWWTATFVDGANSVFLLRHIQDTPQYHLIQNVYDFNTYPCGRFVKLTPTYV